MDRSVSPDIHRRPRLWLAASDGRQVRVPDVAPVDEPERPMAVRFEGLTQAEQRRAIASFPGGQRFVLAG